MRFVSQLIPFWWIIRTVDAFIPFLTLYINSILFVLYGMVAGSVHVLDSYPKWQAKLIAMGTDRAVANTLVLGEWLTSVFASMVSVYWFIPTLFLPYWFVLMAIVTTACHVGLIYAWQSHYSSLLRQFDMHLDDSI